jgi:sigma-54 specific flagellar transcriptional regulator A
MNSAITWSPESRHSVKDARRAKARHEDNLDTRLNGLKDVALRLLSAVESLGGSQIPSESAGLRLGDEVKRFESRLIREALAKTGGNQARAARLLGVKHTTLNAKIKRYQISIGADGVIGADETTEPGKASV